MPQSNEIKFVNTDEFWELMCNSGFYRLSINQGALHGVIYYTDSPPENVKGFLQNKIEVINECLKHD